MPDEGRKNRTNWRTDTLLAHAGLDPMSFHGFVNPPVVRASTVLHKTVELMLDREGQRYPYGLMNTPTIEALTTALTALEGKETAGTVLVPSGLAAVTVAIMAAVRPQTKVLFPDNVYYPSRRFGDEILSMFGAEAVYYDPLSNDDVEAKMKGASVALIEAPGSLTFEMPDIAAIVAAAKKESAVTVFDNTWATPVLYRPLEHGVDMVAYAGTKYFGGHSDLLIGSISANAKAWRRLHKLHLTLGLQAGTEEILADAAWAEDDGRPARAAPAERADDRELAQSAARSEAGALPRPSRRPRSRALEARLRRHVGVVRVRSECERR